MLQDIHRSSIVGESRHEAILSSQSSNPPREAANFLTFLGLALLLMGVTAVAASAFFDAKRSFAFDVSAPAP
jgi:hypothetical protein